MLQSEGKRRLGVFVPPKPPLERAREAARAFDEASARAHFAIPEAARALKTTVSLCADCLGHVPALVYAHEGRVFVRKDCPAHGRSEGLLENDERYYFLSNKDRSGVVFARDRVFDIRRSLARSAMRAARRARRASRARAPTRCRTRRARSSSR